MLKENLESTIHIYSNHHMIGICPFQFVWIPSLGSESDSRCREMRFIHMIKFAQNFQYYAIYSEKSDRFTQKERWAKNCSPAEANAIFLGISKAWRLTCNVFHCNELVRGIKPMFLTLSGLCWFGLCFCISLSSNCVSVCHQIALMSTTHSIFCQNAVDAALHLPPA